MLTLGWCNLTGIEGRVSVGTVAVDRGQRTPRINRRAGVGIGNLRIAPCGAGAAARWFRFLNAVNADVARRSGVTPKFRSG